MLRENLGVPKERTFGWRRNSISLVGNWILWNYLWIISICATDAHVFLIDLLCAIYIRDNFSCFNVKAMGLWLIALEML